MIDLSKIPAYRNEIAKISDLRFTLEKEETGYALRYFKAGFLFRVARYNDYNEKEIIADIENEVRARGFSKEDIKWNKDFLAGRWIDALRKTR